MDKNGIKQEEVALFGFQNYLKLKEFKEFNYYIDIIKETCVLNIDKKNQTQHEIVL